MVQTPFISQFLRVLPVWPHVRDRHSARGTDWNRIPTGMSPFAEAHSDLNISDPTFTRYLFSP